MTLWTPTTNMRRLPYLGLALLSSTVCVVAQTAFNKATGDSALTIWLGWMGVGVLQTRWQYLRWLNAGMTEWVFWTFIIASFTFCFAGGFVANPALTLIGSLAGYCVGLPCLFARPAVREDKLVETFQ